ncbi:hypothetical protein H696_05797 [Fonticula alba]|uniref:Uncharacterized protein n=1 Tax=Fonticula alba TaxID=691883 RepID=A0A058Z2D9_FONAL|nr:hypothetical protein H696_05797 [Fonticula alba]KCV67687.1 hypothetical protein H696_05797 [Fonticula alba]|eukprot:XP_009497871.1 hypothetical protein H696_05797 [Fonticula alba]
MENEATSGEPGSAQYRWKAAPAEIRPSSWPMRSNARPRSAPELASAARQVNSPKAALRRRVSHRCTGGPGAGLRRLRAIWCMSAVYSTRGGSSRRRKFRWSRATQGSGRGCLRARASASSGAGRLAARPASGERARGPSSRVSRMPEPDAGRGARLDRVAARMAAGAPVLLGTPDRAVKMLAPMDPGDGPGGGGLADGWAGPGPGPAGGVTSPRPSTMPSARGSDTPKRSMASMAGRARRLSMQRPGSAAAWSSGQLPRPKRRRREPKSSMLPGPGGRADSRRKGAPRDSKKSGPMPRAPAKSRVTSPTHPDRAMSSIRLSTSMADPGPGAASERAAKLAARTATGVRSIGPAGGLHWHRSGRRAGCSHTQNPDPSVVPCHRATRAKASSAVTSAGARTWKRRSRGMCSVVGPGLAVPRAVAVPLAVADLPAGGEPPGSCHGPGPARRLDKSAGDMTTTRLPASPGMKTRLAERELPAGAGCASDRGAASASRAGRRTCTRPLRREYRACRWKTSTGRPSSRGVCRSDGSPMSRAPSAATWARPSSRPTVARR